MHCRRFEFQETEIKTCISTARVCFKVCFLIRFYYQHCVCRSQSCSGMLTQILLNQLDFFTRHRVESNAFGTGPGSVKNKCCCICDMYFVEKFLGKTSCDLLPVFFYFLYTAEMSVPAANVPVGAA